MAMPYKITSKYKLKPRTPVFTARPTILMQLISKSNKLSPGKFEKISGPEQLYDLFPDDNPHITLQKARHLVDAGYNILAQNVYSSKTPINIRLLQYSDNEIITIPYQGEGDSESTFNLTNFKNSVIKVDLSKVKPKDYIIIETDSGDQATQSNLLVWFHDKTQEEINNYTDAVGNVGESFFIQDYLGISTQFIYYNQSNGISLVNESAAGKFASIVNRCPLSFLCVSGQYSTQFYIASNRSFINIGNHSENIKVSINDKYIQTILNKTRIESRLIDFSSKYNTDNQEIAIKIEKIRDYVYKLGVFKTCEGKILTSEFFTGATNENVAKKNGYDLLLPKLQNSTLIDVKPYAENFKLPEGTLYLTKNEETNAYENAIKVQEIDMFVNGTGGIKIDEVEKCFCYYDSNLNSLRYQQALYKKFKDTTLIGIYTHRGVDITDEPTNLAYFSNQEVVLGNEIYHTADGVLALMLQTSFISGEILTANLVSNTIFKDKYINHINPDSVITMQQLRGYFDGQLKDLRYCMIRPILEKELRDSWDNTINSIMNSIKTVKEIFTQMFDSEINIFIQEFVNTPNDIICKVAYYIEDVVDVDQIDLTLEVTL